MFFLEAILEKPFPSPGERFVVSVVSWREAGKVEDFAFTRPDDNDTLFDYVCPLTLRRHTPYFLCLN